MVRELERVQQSSQFPETAPAANPVFFRTYSRLNPSGRETWEQVCDRTTQGLVKLGKLTPEETDLIYAMQRQLKALTSGRWLWVGGSKWIEQPENFSGAYNCSSTNISDWRAFGLLMDLAMMGCGTGAVLEPRYINQLPPIRHRLNVTIQGEIGSTPASDRRELTEVEIEGNQVTIYVGDSRQGWVGSYQALLELSTDERFVGEVQVCIDISDVRPAGEPLKGFGGVANPVKLPELYQRCAATLNKAVGRQLNSVECCILIDEAAVTIVAGNIRRCLPEDALVHTSKGLVPIRDVQVGDLVQTPLGFRQVVNKFDQGFQDVYEIETNATYPRATLNHRQAVLADAQGGITWKAVNSLVEGDRLQHNTQVLPGTFTYLPPDLTSQPFSSQLTIPNLTSEVAWLIGLTQGNSDFLDGKITWTINSSPAEFVTKIQAKIDSALALFGVTATHVNIKGENTAKSTCTSTQLAEYFYRYIKQPQVTLEVPKFILQGTVDIRAAYLAGLMDSDRPINNRLPYLLTTVYPSFIRQVGAVLSSLGLAGRIIITPPENKWQARYNLTISDLKERYNVLIAPHSVKGEMHPGFNKMYSFTVPGVMRQKTYTYTEMQNLGVQGSRLVDINYESYIAEADISIDIPVTVKRLGSYDHVQTYDIEVEEAHCFYCDGYLTHNSAGMRQFVSDDELGATAKENLWQQDANGNWRIDPERDALRMANHSRVFHHKPTLEECIEAVRKQYYSGEGAIQWAGEAIARANCDILNNPDLKAEFLSAYNQGNAQQWLQKHDPEIPQGEIEHRLGRYGLNPCHSGDTLVSTDRGLIPIVDLVGQHFKALVDLRSVGLDGVKLTDAIAFPTGVQTTYIVTLKNGMQMRCTAEHQHYTNQGWVKTKDLTSEHCVFVQQGEGAFGTGTISVEEAQMLGWWYGDGYNVRIKARRENGGHGRKEDHFAKGFVFNPTEYGLAYPVISSAIANITGMEYITKLHKGVYEFRTQSPALEQFFAKLGIVDKAILPKSFLHQSKEVLIGFLQGIFCADGTVEKGVRRIKLVNKSAKLLQQLQLVLLQLGILSVVRCLRKPGYRGVSYKTADGTVKISADNGSYGLCVQSISLERFYQLIGFPLSLHKQHRLQEWVEKPLPNYPDKTICSKFSSGVKSVEEYGEETVYDLHVPLTHSFVANGCITHNCGEILGADFHCVSKDTFLITRDGIHQIGDLVGREVEIWNGKRWSKVLPMLTGQNRQLYRVNFSDGTFLDVTEKHRFFVKNRFAKEYQELTTSELIETLATNKYVLHTEEFKIDYHEGKFIDPIWAYTLGQLVGDGSICQSNGQPQLQLRLYGAKSDRELSIAGKTSGVQRYYTETKETPCLLYTGFQKDFDSAYVRSLKDTAIAFEGIASWNREAILHFVAGLADADGSEVNSGGIRLYMSGYDRAYRIYLLLLKCGIRSSINLVQTAGTKTNLGERKKDLWYLQITDCTAIPCQRLNTSGGHTPKYKGKSQVIRSIQPLEGLHDTFCFNEPEFHKGVFGGTLTGQCNLSEIHLNQIDPYNDKEQEEAFTAGALSVAVLLNHKFSESRYQYSRELDPIVGVSFTGLFDFFVNAFGVDWLRWWAQGRPDTAQGLEFKGQEEKYLTRWREIVHRVVGDYCDRHSLKRPNRCTTVQPSGTKSLLTGASPGWHPPKAQRFIRRITFRKNDPVALACIDYGYNVVPSQSDKDENGNLLNDPFDERCTEWLVEIPVAVPWADLPGADEIEISKFSAIAQMDFYMQVQKFFVRHNTSATIELRENEVEVLGTRIYEAIRDDEGYISAALLARFDALQNFPRLPFEPISKAQYEQLLKQVLSRRQTDDFAGALKHYDFGEFNEVGPTGCDSDKCLFPEQKS